MNKSLKTLAGIAAIGAVIGVSGCASTPEAASSSSAKQTKEESQKTLMTGSRLARENTDRLLKSVGPDKADEPVRSISNTVGIKGN